MPPHRVLALGDSPDRCEWLPGARFIRIKGARLQPSVYMAWNRDRQPPGLAALIHTVQQSLKGAKARSR